MRERDLRGKGVGPARGRVWHCGWPLVRGHLNNHRLDSSAALGRKVPGRGFPRDQPKREPEARGSTARAAGWRRAAGAGSVARDSVPPRPPQWHLVVQLAPQAPKPEGGGVHGWVQQQEPSFPSRRPLSRTAYQEFASINTLLLLNLELPRPSPEGACTAPHMPSKRFRAASPLLLLALISGELPCGVLGPQAPPVASRPERGLCSSLGLPEGPPGPMQRCMRRRALQRRARWAMIPPPGRRQSRRAGTVCKGDVWLQEERPLAPGRSLQGRSSRDVIPSPAGRSAWCKRQVGPTNTGRPGRRGLLVVLLGATLICRLVHDARPQRALV